MSLANLLVLLFSMIVIRITNIVSLTFLFYLVSYTIYDQYYLSLIYHINAKVRNTFFAILPIFKELSRGYSFLRLSIHKLEYQ
jgi:hypothetical protein